MDFIKCDKFSETVTEELLEKYGMVLYKKTSSLNVQRSMQKSEFYQTWNAR